MVSPIDYDTLAAEYARNRRLHPEVLRSLLAMGQLHAGSRVLEVGCGTGNYIAAIDSHVHCACWGIDPSEQMLAIARQRSANVQLQAGRAEALDYPPAFFDLVFSVDVIHHVGDRAAYFRQARRVLRPGGSVGTVTDSEWIIRHRQPLSVYFPETVEPELARYPRIADLCAAMAEAGLGAIGETVVEYAYDLADSQPYRDKAFSSLHLIAAAAFQRGLERMEADLRRGPIPCVSRYLLLWGTA